MSEAARVTLKFVVDASEVRQTLQEIRGDAARPVRVGGGNGGGAPGPGGNGTRNLLGDGGNMASGQIADLQRIAATDRGPEGRAAAAALARLSGQGGNGTGPVDPVGWMGGTGGYGYETLVRPEPGRASSAAAASMARRERARFTGAGVDFLDPSSPSAIANRQQALNAGRDERRAAEERAINDQFDRMGERLTAKGEKQEERVARTANRAEDIAAAVPDAYRGVYDAEASRLAARGEDPLSAARGGARAADQARRVNAAGDRAMEGLGGGDQAGVLNRVNQLIEREGMGLAQAFARARQEYDRHTQEFQQFTRRQASEREQLARATLSADVANADPRQRVEILRGALAGADPNSVEYQNIRRQLGQAERDAGAGGLLNRVSRLGAAFFAAREIGSAVGAFQNLADEQFVDAFGTRQERMASARRAAAGNPLGTLQVGIGYAMQFAGENGLVAPPSSFLGQFVRGAGEYAVRNSTMYRVSEANQIQQGEDAENQMVAGFRGSQTAAQARSFAAQDMGVTDPFARARSEARHEDAMRAMQRVMARRNLQDRRNVVGLSAQEKAEIDLQLKYMDAGEAVAARADQELLGARLADADRREGLAINQRSYANLSAGMGQAGYGRVAARAAVDAQFNVRRDANGAVIGYGEIDRSSPQFGGIDASYNYALRAGEVNYQRQANAMEANTVALSRRSALASRLDELAGERKSLDEAYTDHQSDDYLRGKANLDAREERAKRDEADRRRLENLGLDTRGNVLDALMARSRGGADVARMVGGTREDVQRMEDQGDYPEAYRRRGLGVKELQLYQQDYLDRLQGQQLGSKFALDTQNRSGEPPEKILADIRQGISDLNKLLSD